MKKFLLITLGLFILNVQAKNLPTRVMSMPHNEISQPNTDKINLYPNPAKDYFVVQVMNNLNVKSISIHSLIGNMVTSKTYNKNSSSNQAYQFDVSNFKKGKYLVRVVFSDGTSEVKALIKQ